MSELVQRMPNDKAPKIMTKTPSGIAPEANGGIDGMTV